MISVIQGVALATLVGRVARVLDNHVAQNHVNSTAFWQSMIYAVVTFFYIVTITYEYMPLAGVLRWPHGVWDTALPLCLGVGQALVAIFIDQPAMWWAWSAVLAVTGCAALLNTACHVNRLDFGRGPDGAAAFRATRGLLRLAMGFVGSVALLGVLGAWFFRPTRTPCCHAAALASVMGGLGYLLWREHKWYRFMHEVFGFGN